MSDIFVRKILCFLYSFVLTSVRIYYIILIYVVMLKGAIYEAMYSAV